jgi:hypothetical protein
MSYSGADRADPRRVAVLRRGARAERALAWGVSVATTLLAVALHVVVLRHAGALWRDEVNLANLSSLPIAEIEGNMVFDSSSPGCVLFFHAYQALGLGSDVALRALGMVVGLSLLAALWLAARCFGTAPPLLSLLLFGLSPAVLRYGDSIRAYGLGAAAGIVTVALLWRLLEAPTPGRTLLAALVSVLAAQLQYQTAVVVAIGVVAGLAVVMAEGRRPHRLRALLFVGGAAGISSLLSLGAGLAVRAFALPVRRPVALLEVVRAAAVTLGRHSLLALAVWLLAGLGVGAAVVARLRRRSPGVDRPSLLLFLSIAASLTLVVCPVFLLSSRIAPLPWLFIPFLGLFAVALDGLAAVAMPRAWLAAATAVAAAAVAPSSWAQSHVPHTNVDRVAAALGARARRGDLIVVSPYFCGISFGRYYRGAADWMVLPNGDRPRVCRTDRILAAMRAEDPLAALRRRIDASLAAGHRLFVVVEVPVFPAPPGAPPRPVVPDPTLGWNAGPSFRFWELSLAHHLAGPERQVAAIEVPADDVSHLERLRVSEVRAWRSQAPQP